MRLGQLALAAAVIALNACGRSQPTDRNAAPPAGPVPVNGAEAPTSPQPPKPPPAVPAATGMPVVDPKSSAAAQEVARAFVDLLNRGRFHEAYMLLGPGAPPRADFDRQFTSVSDLHVSIGLAGPQEGAAGSIYVSIPIRVFGRGYGGSVVRPMTVILRRVNDVPGSTEAQRHWHIDRVEVPAA